MSKTIQIMMGKLEACRGVTEDILYRLDDDGSIHRMPQVHGGTWECIHGAEEIKRRRVKAECLSGPGPAPLLPS